MKEFTFLLLAVLATILGNAQVRVSGTVKDNKGRIIIGASVSIKDSYDGGVSDSSGRFSFKTSEKGAQTVVASNIGYKSAEQAVVIGGDSVVVSLSLKEEISELKAVTVTAGSFEAGDRKKAATVLSSLDVYTTGGANADITAVVKTLPGAQQVGEQEGLFVRGGAGYEAKQFIDGTLVNNPFGASVPDIASRGRFSPSLFKGTIFSTGGYSALYGQALSSALIMESIDLPERSEATVSISSVFLGAGLQQIAKDKKSSWGGNYGYTNLLPYFSIVKQKPDYFAMPQFHSGDANFRIKTKGGIVKYYTTFSNMDLGLRRANIDDPALKNAFGLNNTNWYNNLSWRENLGGGWKMNLGIGYSTDRNRLSQEIQDANNKAVTTGMIWIDSTNFRLNTTGDLTQAKLVLDKRLSGISVLRVGGEYMYFYNKSLYNGMYTRVLTDHFKALFSEADLYITNDLAAKVGARFEHSSVINKMNIAPRLSLAYKTGSGGQMSIAYGEFYQKPENTYLFVTNNFGYTKATHYIANYIKNTALQTFRAEVFYKKYNALVKTYPSYNNDGSGDAKGFELFWRDKKTIKGLDYWVSYSWLDTKRDFLNYPQQLQPTFAANHTASLVVKKFFTKINTGFNFTYSFATGRPYYNMRLNNGKYEIADQGKTINYNNLGFSFNYLTSIGKAYAVWVGSVTNVFNSKQVFGYNYSHDGARKEAIQPPAPQFFFLGVFLSWGVDRRQDAINNNL